MSTLRNIAVSWGVKVDKTDLFALERLMMRLQRSFLAIGAAAGLALGGIVSYSAKVEDALNRVMSLTEATGDEYDKLRKYLYMLGKDVSEKFGVDLVEVFDDFFNILNTGVPAATEKFEKLVDVVEMLKLTADINSKEAARVLLRAGTAFGETPQRIGDMLFMASKMAPTFVEEIAAALLKAGPAGKFFNQTMQSVLATLATFATMAQSGSQAGTRYRSGMLRLVVGVGQAGRALESLGLTSKDLFLNSEQGTVTFRNMADVFDILRERMKQTGVWGMRQSLAMLFGRRVAEAYMAVLMQNSEVLREFERRLKESGGVLEDAFLIRMDATARKGDQLASSWKNLVDALGMPFLGFIGQLAVKFRLLTRGLRDLLEGSPKVQAATSYFVNLGLAIVAAGSSLGILLTVMTLFYAALKRMGMAGALLWPLFLKPMLWVAAFLLFAVALEDIIGSFYGLDSVFGMVMKKLNIGLGQAISLASGLIILVLAGVYAISGPIGLIVVGLILAGIAVVEIIRHWEELDKLMRETKGRLKRYFEEMFINMRYEFKKTMSEIGEHGLIWALLYGDLGERAYGILHKMMPFFFPTGEQMANRWKFLSEEGYNSLLDLTYAVSPPTSSKSEVTVQQNLTVEQKPGENTGDTAARAFDNGAARVDDLGDFALWLNMSLGAYNKDAPKSSESKSSESESSEDSE